MSTIINATTTNGVVIQPDNSGSLVLQTNNGTTALTIDTSQNVGIGTTSPATKLQVSGASGSLNTRINAGNTGLDITPNDATGVTDLATTPLGGGGKVMTFTTYTGSASAERMRIDSSGKVGIGMSPTDSLTIQCSSQGFGGGLGFKLSGGANNWSIVVGGDAKLYLGYTATTSPAAVGNFATNGTYTATSDIRKKKDISYIFNGLDIVNSLKPAQGRMLEDDDTSPLRPMFIAQDMVDVIPALVSNLEPTPSDDPLLGVDYASIAPILVKAIQEQQTIINDLKARVETLEAK